jgi:hypothetical protein
LTKEETNFILFLVIQREQGIYDYWAHPQNLSCDQVRQLALAIPLARIGVAENSNALIRWQPSIRKHQCVLVVNLLIH